MSSQLDAQIDAVVDANLDASVAEMIRLCRQPSVSTQAQGIDDTAELVADLMREHGLEARVIPLPNGYPIVYGEAPGLVGAQPAPAEAGGGSPTVLFYNHYDVQPPEPLELWDSPPFEPRLRAGRLFARGVADDKGHIICRLAALDALRAAYGGLPCRVKFLVEGEEEIGSPNLAPFVTANHDLLQADACFWESGGVNEHGQPELYFGMRGICYVQLSVRTIDRDAHSGFGGSILPNAAWRLVWALNSIKGPDGQVRIPGFYDNIVPPTRRDLEMLARLPDEEQELRRAYGVDRFLNGVTGPDLRRESVFSPTATICGLSAGYQGPGSKTVLPAAASAKVDFRLVPNQDPEDVLAKLRRHLDAAGFGDVEIEYMSGDRPARVDPDDPFSRLTIATAEEVYGKPAAVWPIVGSSGPMYPFVVTLGVPIATPGIGYNDSRVHSPNENVRVADFALGTKLTARLVSRFCTPT